MSGETRTSVYENDFTMLSLSFDLRATSLPFFVFFRRCLRETLKMSNAEESHRLTACSLILLGHTFLKNGNLKVLTETTRNNIQK